MPCIRRPLRAYSCNPPGANHSRPSHLLIAARASFSSLAKGSCACGLIARRAPVSITSGVAQNGHSVAWLAPSNSITAPQLGQVRVRVSSIAAAGGVPWAALL